MFYLERKDRGYRVATKCTRRGGEIPTSQKFLNFISSLVCFSMRLMLFQALWKYRNKIIIIRFVELQSKGSTYLHVNVYTGNWSVTSFSLCSPLQENIYLPAVGKLNSTMDWIHKRKLLFIRGMTPASPTARQIYIASSGLWNIRHW